MRVPVLVFLMLLIGRFNAQMIDIIIPGSVNNYETKANIFGSTLYLVQDGVTLSKTITSSAGEYNITGKVNKNIPFELIVSKPNYISKKVYFDFKTITSKGKDFSVQAVAELVVELFAVKKGVSIVTAATDYAEKFTWDNDQKIAIPDENYKKLSDEKIINFYKDAEKNALVSIYLNKATASATAKNYQNAIAYSDSALVYKQNDNTILVKKVAYQKNLAEQVAEQKKIDDLAKLLLDGETFIQADKLTEATAKFNEVLKKDPLNVQAKKQIEEIKKLSLTKKNQTNDANELKKIRVNVDKFITVSKFAEASIELNKAMKLTLTKDEKTKIESELVDLKSKIKEASILKEITDQLKLAKLADDGQNYTKSKEYYSKVIELVSFLNPTSSKKQVNLINNQQDESTRNALKIANGLFAKSEYSKAIISYKLSELLINELLDKEVKKLKLDEVKTRIEDAEQKQRDDDKKYKDAVAKVIFEIDNAPLGLTEALNLISKDPIKSKASNQEIVDLKTRINGLKNYYADKKIKFKNLPNDSIKSQKIITDLYNLAQILKVPSVELTKIKFSTDSINNKVNARKLNVSQTNRSGITLAAPGILSVATPGSSYEQLELTRKSNENGNQKDLVEVKQRMESDEYFRAIQHDAENYSSSQQVQKIITDNDVLNQEKAKSGDQIAANFKEFSQNNENSIYQRESTQINEQIEAAKNVQNEKNKVDKLLYTTQLKADSATSSQVIKIQTEKNSIDVKNAQLGQLTNQDAAKFQLVRNQHELDKYKQDSLVKSNQELAAKALIAQSNFKESTVRNPNFIRDENGICFPWNELSERVYDVKNAAGFVVSVIVRRVVVDQYGFGEVFEHTRNERGISSFTLNGSPITEFIWFNQSSGNGVLIPNLKVLTAC